MSSTPDEVVANSQTGHCEASGNSEVSGDHVEASSGSPDQGTLKGFPSFKEAHKASGMSACLPFDLI